MCNYDLEYITCPHCGEEDIDAMLISCPHCGKLLM